MTINALVCVVSAQPNDTWPKAVTVCDILRDPDAYASKMVAVRGRFSDTHEGWWLAGEGCDGVFQTGRYKWRSLLWLAALKEIQFMDPRRKAERSAFGLRDPSFEVDEQALGAFRTLARENQDKLSVKMTVTFLGLFETFHPRPLPSGSISVLGFGHEGAAPGQLIMKSVSLKDIVIETGSEPARR
jgi:hypothetical protein